MSNIEYETQEQNSFLADVFHYMQEHKCDKETAMKEVEKLYR